MAVCYCSFPEVHNDDRKQTQTEMPYFALGAVFHSVKSLTGVGMLRVPTSLDHRGSRSLEMSSCLHSMHGQPRRILSIKHILNLKDALATLEEHTVYEFTLHFINSLCKIRMVGGRWNCQRNRMWYAKRTQVTVRSKDRMLFVEAFLVLSSSQSPLPSLNSDSICCLYQSCTVTDRGAGSYTGDRLPGSKAWCCYPLATKPQFSHS